MCQAVTGRPSVLDFVNCAIGMSGGSALYERIPTATDRGPDQLMLRALVGRLPLETMRSTVHLEEIVKLSTVVCRVSQCQKRTLVSRGGDGRSMGLVESKTPDIMKKTRLRSAVFAPLLLTGLSVHPRLLYTLREQDGNRKIWSG